MLLGRQLNCLYFVLLTIGIFFTLTSSQQSKCGYNSCQAGQSGMLNVHIVPHTHDDVGWLKTVDQYYYGARNDIQHAGVQYILDTTMNELLNDPSKRFIYVEVAFFYRWWNEQDGVMQRNVRQLVDEGRLQFILGGWSMNDEATTHYTAIIDQHTRGLRFLNENFGDCGRPLVAWQIDPFGHSKEQAHLFAQMGFDGLFFARLDYQEKNLRLTNKTLEMIWRGNDLLKGKGDLFTNVLYNHYCPPDGFWFDQGTNDAPIMDDPTMFDYNVQERVDDFIKAVTDQAKHYTSGNILIPMGCDFEFENARVNYKNLDKLIFYVNARQSNGSKVNLFYSTPSCYVYAVNKEGQRYDWKTDDFFPYADKENAFWTGYFVSRAALKGYVRQMNNRLQVAQQLAILSGTENVAEERIDALRRTMGVLQHHDAVSGTEKQAVAYDYAQRLSIASNGLQSSLSVAINQLLNRKIPSDWFTCDLLNISRCLMTENINSNSRPISLFVYNSYSQIDSRYVHVPVSCEILWTVVNVTSGLPLPVQLTAISDRTKGIPERGNSSADCELHFHTITQALGHSTYLLIPSSGNYDEIISQLSLNTVEKNSYQDSPISLENEYIRVEFDPTTSMSSRIINKVSGIQQKFQHSLQYYYGVRGTKGAQSSGAYVFRPTTNQSTPGTPKITSLLKGLLFQEISIEFEPWMTAVYRLYRTERKLEIEWTVGPIPDDNNLAREVIMNYETDIPNNGIVKTDANGRQMLTRKRNIRVSVPNFVQTEPVSGNYYPINSRIELPHNQGVSSLTIFNDRSQGGGSIRDGQIELMVHRRTLNDDNYGVGEPLKEQGSDGKGLIVRGKHWIMLETPQTTNLFQPRESQRIFYQPTLFFSNDIFIQTDKTWSRGLIQEISENVHILTLDNWKNGKSKLLRLEHIAMTNETESIDLDNLITNFNKTIAIELTLAGNQYLSDSKRLVWNTNDGQRTPRRKPSSYGRFGSTITLQPTDIRTFEIQPRNN
jgi:lysosomal alpha-mannosidase